jgi:hypothetical protein
MNEKYFTERLFWLFDTNTLLHVSFMHGHGWTAVVEVDPPFGGYHFSFCAATYAELMQRFDHRKPELLLQEEW